MGFFSGVTNVVRDVARVAAPLNPISAIGATIGANLTDKIGGVISPKKPGQPGIAPGQNAAIEAQLRALDPQRAQANELIKKGVGQDPQLNLQNAQLRFAGPGIGVSKFDRTNFQREDENRKAQGFDYLRTQARQQANAAQDQAQDALKRRFAAIGGTGGGSFIKQVRLAQQAGQEQLGNQLGQIGFQEQQASQQLQEAARARNLQRDVTQEQLNFQKSQVEQQLGVQRADFGLRRDLARSDFEMKKALSQADFDFKKKLADLDAGAKLKQIDLAERQFIIDKETTDFNKRISEIEAGRQPKKSLLGDIFGGII